MPNTDFSKSFMETTESASTMTNIALAGNFVINLLIMGAMGFLWGLLHCMQIISHFYLVNITMPANADYLFRIIVQIATFNIVPTDDLIQNIESCFGIKNDDFVLTESFIDFEFDSTAPIRNL